MRRRCDGTSRSTRRRVRSSSVSPSRRGQNCLGRRSLTICVVRGRRRIPSPPARMSAHGGVDDVDTVHSTRRETRSEEHTSELQSLAYLVCRLLLEKKKKKRIKSNVRTAEEQLTCII